MPHVHPLDTEPAVPPGGDIATYHLGYHQRSTGPCPNEDCRLTDIHRGPCQPREATDTEV